MGLYERWTAEGDDPTKIRTRAFTLQRLGF